MYQLLDDSMSEHRDEFYFKQCLEWLRPILVDDSKFPNEEASTLYSYTLAILDALRIAYDNPNIRKDFYYDVMKFLQYLSYRYGFDPATGVGIVPPKSEE